MSDYDYGNARLRARKSSLFGVQDLRTMLAADSVDGLLGLLSATRYRPDVEAAMPRFRGMRRLDAAVALNVGRTLREVAGFYAEDAARAVGLLVERWDVRNLRAALRGAAARAAPAQIQAAMVPAGTFDAGTLRALAAASGVRALLELLVSLGVPDRRAANAIFGAWPVYESTQDLAHVELAIDDAYASRWEEELTDLELPVLHRVFVREADRTDVMTAVRLSAEDEVVLSKQEPWGRGSIAPAVLRSAATAPSRDRTVEMLMAVVPAPWATALAGWADHGDLTRLSNDIDAALTHELIGLFAAGDPLSIDIPIAFTAAVENEARNLRLAGRSIAAGLPPSDTLEVMVTPW